VEELVGNESGGNGVVGVREKGLPVLLAGQPDEDGANAWEICGQGVTHDTDLEGVVDDELLAVCIELSLTLEYLMPGCCLDGLGGLGGNDESRVGQCIRNVGDALAQPDDMALGGTCDEVTMEVTQAGGGIVVDHDGAFL
jgi:hypothetical protein